MAIGFRMILILTLYFITILILVFSFLIIDLIRGVVILFSFALVLGYFVWYPRYRYKKGFTKSPVNEEKASLQGLNISLTEIKTSGRIFTETFIVFGNTFRKTITNSLVLALLATITFSICIGGNFRVLFNYNYEIWRQVRSMYNDLWSWSSLNIVMNFRHMYTQLILIGLCTITLLLCTKILSKYVMSNRETPPINIRVIISALLTSTLLCLSLHFSIWAIFSSIVLMPILLLWYFTGYFEQTGLLKSLNRTFSLLKGSWGKMMGLFIMVALMQWIALFVTNEEVIQYIVQFIEMNIPSTIEISKYTTEILSVFIAYLLMVLLFPLTIFSNAILYFTLVETVDATNLRESLSKIGFKKKAYGLEIEK